MNGKFILLLFICLNVASLVGSSVCLEQTNQCSFGDNFILNLFIKEQNLDSFTDNVNTIGGAGLNDTFNEEIGSITNEQSGGTEVGSSIFGFLDGLKMVLGLLFLLTPIPLLSFIASAGLPLILVLILGIIPTILYVLAIMEFIRGASF